MSALPVSRAALRRELLTRRSRIDVAERGRADAALIERLRGWLDQPPIALPAYPWIAWYWPMRGEPDLRPLWNHVGRAALPVVHTREAPLSFAPFTSAETLRPDTAGVLAPVGPSVIPDLIIAPCVGFAATPGGWLRLGYGGGYYDRTLAELLTPALGVAYDWAQVSGLEPAAHDQALVGVVTDGGVY